ncbi:hypothetical protein BPLS_P6630 [Bathymodiolus platifrons methanotrophic gill symbiont]|uniref:hypothetical protein n=1 Tax=Bathymodiolus platifrons methanotrophic gill symbiont TaxID=113268 RepID=UPI0011CB9055|nr:hypothetical protein [Bathymodiolus platifrons methanotrophic gill symbiont]TXL23055.1 hypothetical protein BMR03_04595 [Methylococcaceae bacterium HT2]GFO77897.1 hypothetical protein BPLS_P6630 [Bathymodiolus platifrons methanotrophic gill symbiont]
MADFSKVKGKTSKKNRFGSPIPDLDASATLEAPEHAPLNPEVSPKKVRGKTGRTEPFSTRVSKEFIKDFKRVAFDMELKKVDLLEESLKAYKEKYNIR